MLEISAFFKLRRATRFGQTHVHNSLICHNQNMLVAIRTNFLNIVSGLNDLSEVKSLVIEIETIMDHCALGERDYNLRLVDARDVCGLPKV